MQIHTYSKEEPHEFLQSKEANLDILETKEQGKKVFLIPANSTEIEPPATNSNEVAVFDVSLQQWEVKKDFRGKTIYNKSDCTENLKVTVIGEINPGYTLLPPITRFDYWFEEKWVTDQEAKLGFDIREEEAKYINLIAGKKLNELIVEKLIKDKIISDKGEILNYDYDLDKSIPDMIEDLKA